jgi:hypothetical protein
MEQVAKLKGPIMRGKSARQQAWQLLSTWWEAVNFDGIWRLKLAYARITEVFLIWSFDHLLVQYTVLTL